MTRAAWLPHEQRYVIVRPRGEASGAANPFGRHPLTRYEWAWDQLAVRDGRHLDVGCNAGVLVAALHEGTRRAVVGVDVNGACLRSLRERQPDALAVQVGPRDPLPFADASFATVSVLDVAEHAPDDAALLAEAARVLEPGGLLVLTVPAEHAFSFLDPDNAKLRWPRLHRAFWRARRGRRAQEQEAVGQQAVAGMVGDLALERSEHTNYAAPTVVALLASVGLRVEREEGSGLFFRWFQLAALLLPGMAGRLAERLMIGDAHLFRGPPGSGVRRRSNLFVAALKPTALSDGGDESGQGAVTHASP